MAPAPTKGVRRLDDLQEKLNSILSSPAEMEKIMAMARSLSGDSAPATAPSPAAGPPDTSVPAVPSETSQSAGLTLDGLDLNTVGMIMRVMQESNKASDKTAIIGAITPHLREERRGKVEQALKIAHMASMAKILFGSGGGDST